jgi:hypothetical protein
MPNLHPRPMSTSGTFYEPCPTCHGTIRPADDAPTMCQAIEFILIDAHLLLRGDSVLQDWSGR